MVVRKHPPDHRPRRPLVAWRRYSRLEKVGVTLMLLGLTCAGLGLALFLAVDSTKFAGALILVGGVTFFAGDAMSPFDTGPTSGG